LKKPADSIQKKEELRQRAEQELSAQSNAVPAALTTNERKLFHELQVHQIELEMQNEALQQAKALLEISRDEYQNRFVDLYDFAPVGYLTLNGENLITESNLTAASMLGIERSNMILHHFFQWISKESCDCWHRQFLHLKQDGGKQNCELVMQRSDGSTFNARVDCCFVPSKEQNPSVHLALTDITEHKRVEHALQESAVRKDEFLAMLAHELRNPLAPISNAVQILKQPTSDPAKIAWCTNIINRQLEHLTLLVDDLLDVSRISRGVAELRTEILEIRDFIQPALESIQPLIESRQQEFTMTLPPECIWVEGDRIRLSQILLNLINNAAKFTQKGGHIWLAVEVTEHKVSFRVSDNGCGIDPVDLPHLFDLFYQANLNLDRSQGGLGIGLSLVNKLVEMHGGDVKVFSAGRGQGSEFVVSLPRHLTPIPECGQNAPSLMAPESSPKKLRILLVDDNYDVADSLGLLLDIEGHLVQKAYDGESALEMVEIEQPDVIVIDIGLPGMDGYTLAKELRRSEKLVGTLLIAFSGYGRPEDKEKSRAAGINEHLIKPSDNKKLLKILNDYCTTALIGQPLHK
jgi:PAS domain S-box-containing protein